MLTLRTLLPTRVNEKSEVRQEVVIMNPVANGN